ncbi:MAG TPA: hypothetical protein DCO86_01160 [Spirochaetaceae bacterium]|nr:hypothetical protein [Spirochaetaceae bacterium]
MGRCGKKQGNDGGAGGKGGSIGKLFALLCVQSSFDKIYGYILENSKELSAELFKNLIDEDFQLYKDMFADKDERRRCALFFKDFYELLDDNHDGADSTYRRIY